MIHIKVDDHIRIKRVQNEDAEELYRVINQNRTHLRKWIGWVDNIVREEEFIRIVDSWNLTGLRNDGVHLAIFYNGDIVGMIDFLYVDQINLKTELACWLAKSHMGKGVMTKATKAVVDFAFNELDLNRVEIRSAVDNLRSRAIPERLGFINEGRLREVEKINGEYYDHICYSMLSRDWKTTS